MSFALSTIIIIILLLPGAVLQISYYNAIKVKAANRHIPFSDLLYRGIIYSLIIHILALFLLKIFNVYIELNFLYQIILGEKISTSDKHFTNAVLQFSMYNIVIISFSWLMAKVFKLFIRINNIDINFHWFRLSNYWFLIFSGRYLMIDNIPGEIENADFLFLDVLCENDIIYSGILIDFNYSPHKDELENLILSTTRKRRFSKNYDTEINKELPDNTDRKSTTGDAEEIPGDVFIVPATQIININIYYIKIDDLENDTKIEKQQKIIEKAPIEKANLSE